MVDDLMTSGEVGLGIRWARERVVRAILSGRLDGHRDRAGRWWVTRASFERLKNELATCSRGEAAT